MNGGFADYDTQEQSSKRKPSGRVGAPRDSNGKFMSGSTQKPTKSKPSSSSSSSGPKVRVPRNVREKYSTLKTQVKRIEALEKKLDKYEDEVDKCNQEIEQILQLGGRELYNALKSR